MKVKRVFFFTDPYPDELISSAVSRYLACTPGLTRSQLLTDLYGRDSVKPNLLFGNNLNDLALRLGPEYQPEKLLFHHTVFPFFSPFLTESQREKVLNSIMSGSHPVSHLLGLSRYNYPVKPVKMRYCPVCRDLDIQNYGETYFHTKHHLPGVDICPDHLVWLEDYPLEVWESFNPFLRADETLMNKTARVCDFEPEIRLAQSARQVINNFSLDLNSQTILKKLERTYQDRNLLFRNRINFKGVYEMLLDCYSQDYLNSKGLVLTRDRISRNPWLFSNSPGRNRGNLVPYQCLLIINCFYNDYNEFLTVPAELRQQEEWKCLNPFCCAYHTSDSTHVTYRRGRKQSRAIVLCKKCRMIYTQNSQRKGKQTTLQYGKLWYEKVRELRDQGESISKISSITGVDKETLLKRLEENKTNPVDERVRHSREVLIELKEKDPDLTRWTLNQKDSAVYKTLLDFDDEWLDSHLPKKAGRDRSKNVVVKNDKNYQELDNECTEKVEKIYQKYLSIIPPKRIFKQMFLNELDLNNKKIKLLPQTEKAIEAKVESTVSYNIRKGYYYVNILLERGEPVTRNRLRNLGVSKIYNEEVSKAVMSYYDSIMNNNSF